MDSQNPKHIRRKRYKGSHPRTFKDKYKEQQPDLYAADVAKVIAQGKTPAGMHRSICVDEIMECLRVKPGQIGLDATLGYGGHSLEFLERLQPGGVLYATDVDPLELPRTEERLTGLGYSSDTLKIRKLNFSDIGQVVSESGPLNFILADLGVSSMQIDNPDRGFSFKVDGPLDLRLDPHSGYSAAELLKKLSEDDLQNILLENSDEPFAELIARAIKNKLAQGMVIETTLQLKDVIFSALKFLAKDKTDEIKKSCQRSFQAIRIHINDEFGALDSFLEKIPDALASGGRVAILSFHSGEDRRVKKSFQHNFRDGVFSEISDGPVKPSAVECIANPRARSAKLRWAVKA